MTPERLAEIERLANEATPGPWEWDLDVFNEDGEIESCVGAGIPIAMLFRAATGLKTTTDGNTRETWHKAEKAQEAKDAAYIAAANPAALLDLIAHIRDLETQVRELSDFKEQFIDKEVKWLTAQAKWIAERNDLEAQVREAREALGRIAFEDEVVYLGCADLPFCQSTHDEHCPVRIARDALATATPPSPEVDYRREGEHGRPLPNNWPSPEVGE